MTEPTTGEVTFGVNILSAQKVIWQGRAVALSAYNSDGHFDVLPYHAKFITLLVDEPLIIKLPGGEERKFAFSRSVLHFAGDQADIYADI